jgi:hypothetical protein
MRKWGKKYGEQPLSRGGNDGDDEDNRTEDGTCYSQDSTHYSQNSPQDGTGYSQAGAKDGTRCS